MAEVKKVEGAKSPNGEKVTFKYKCVTKCYYNEQLFYEGEVLESDVEIKDIPSHCFKKC